MNMRMAKKLRKEMLGWGAGSVVRHRAGIFRKAWKLELKAAKRGYKWATAK